jgi:hypothetical protein
MKKLLRILPYLTMVWVAMYVNKETGKIAWKSEKVLDYGYGWTTFNHCTTAAQKIQKDSLGDYYFLGARTWDNKLRGHSDRLRPKHYKPVCYRLTKYSTR